MRRFAYRLGLFALLMPIVIPAGVMAAPVKDGWFLSLCPDGMPPQVMALLLGDAHHHHHHHADEQTQPAQCDLAGLGVDVLVSPISAAELSHAVTDHLWHNDVESALVRRLLRYESRAPPEHS